MKYRLDEKNLELGSSHVSYRFRSGSAGSVYRYRSWAKEGIEMTGLFERGRAEEELDWREREPCGYSTCCKGRGSYVTSRMLGKARPAQLTRICCC